MTRRPVVVRRVRRAPALNAARREAAAVEALAGRTVREAVAGHPGPRVAALTRAMVRTCAEALAGEEGELAAASFLAALSRRYQPATDPDPSELSIAAVFGVVGPGGPA